MPTPFEHASRFYRFEKTGNEYLIIRDDGLIAWDVYPSASWLPEKGWHNQRFHAYRPAFATVQECKQALIGERPATYYHEIIFAATAYDAQRIREQEDIDAAKAKGETA